MNKEEHKKLFPHRVQTDWFDSGALVMPWWKTALVYVGGGIVFGIWNLFCLPFWIYSKVHASH